MPGRSRAFVSAFLPLLALGLYHARGAGSHEQADVAATTSGVAQAAVSRNAPPTITVAAIADAQVGATFVYQPAVQDPDRDILRFTAVNLPAWASLDPATGRISGTPGPDDAGLYESISITVADATHVVVTAPFSIAVNPAADPAPEPALESGSGVASLQWEVPPSKVSGEPLDDLVGYRILYGRSSSDLDHSVMVPDPATTSFQISSLTSGVWYFAVVAINSNGLEGPPTTLTSKSI
ncbi:MAG TPA: putative Ig domain-containing protein [Steroidobacteraceae bacterium]|nr:putative Ig domain-containing protein [Steroidobacteraceae bacterium]